MNVTEERLRRLRARLDQEGLDALVIRRNSDLRWVTGLQGVFDEEDAHAAFITADAACFDTDSRYLETFRERLDGTGWQVDGTRAAPVLFWTRMLAPGAYRIAIEHDLRLSEYRSLLARLDEEGLTCELVESKELVLGLRAVKDASEIALMREAQAITDAGFAHLCSFMRPGLTEREVAFELEFFMRRQGSEGLAFPSIVAAGPHGASPHAVPSDTVLERGDLVVLDFGARVGDYRSDMTRTVCLGEPTGDQREVYDIVLDVQTRAKAMVRAGVTGAEVHDFAAGAIADAGYGDCFGHGLGHGVGIDIHELPVLSPRADAPLVAGNVVTVEPGIYLPGRFGVRIEDYGVVREGSLEVLTSSPHELMVL